MSDLDARVRAEWDAAHPAPDAWAHTQIKPAKHHSWFRTGLRVFVAVAVLTSGALLLWATSVPPQ